MLAQLIRLGGRLAPTLGPRPRAAGAAARAGAVAVGRVVPAAAFVFVIVLWAVPHLATILFPLRVFEPTLGDGPYQTFNPLRRIAAGERGGADFQCFHGIGLPYLHYPIFSLAGKTIVASELSRITLCFAQYLFGYLFVFGCLTRRVTPTLALTAAALILGDQLWLLQIVYPTNSSIGVRSAVPLLLFGVLLAGLRPSREAVILGAGAAVAVALGTEHGIAASVALGLVWVGRRCIGHPAGQLRPLALGMTTFAVTLAGLLLAICGPDGAVRALRYALVDVPADQFWFFGAPPQNYVYSVKALPVIRDIWVTAIGPAAVCAAIMVGWASRDRAARPLAVILLPALFCGLLGGVGYLGYISIHYLQPLGRLSVVVGLVLAWRAWSWATTRAPFAAEAGRALRLALGVVTAVAIVAGPTFAYPSSVVMLPTSARVLREHVEILRDGRTVMGPGVSKFVEEVMGAIDGDRAARGVTRPPVIWNTYAGEVEARYGVRHPATDYIIHAIGPTGREQYLEAFRRAQPDYVILCKPEMEFEQWLQHATWGFYEEVLLNYQPLRYAGLGVVWRRADGTWRSPDPQAGRVTRDPAAPNRFAVEPPPGTPPGAPVVVEVEYEIQNPFRRVPVVGALPRHLLMGTGQRYATPVSLPPYRTSWTFPVFPADGRTPEYFAATTGPVGGARVTITKVHVRPMRVDGREQFLLNPDLIPRR